MAYDRRTTISLAFGLAGLLHMSGRAWAQVAPARPLSQESLDSFRDPNNSGTIRLPAGIFECTDLVIGSNTRLIGAGQGRTVLRPTRGAIRPVLINADPVDGNRFIEIRAITIDGRASDQDRTINGIQMENVSQSIFEIEITNCFGSGFLLSGGRENRFGPTMYCHSNGRRGAGYGLYIFGSSDNLVRGGRFDDNCIGVAIEASRPGVKARNNRLIGVRCTGNRADFGQSGAGIHFEQSEGGNCDGGQVLNPRCTGSTGVGINNTGCALKIEGGYCGQNREAGVVTIAAIGFVYDGIVCEDNAPGGSTGYRSEMRFDDSGLVPGSRGTVTNCRLVGTAPDGGMRTMSRHSAIRFVGNSVTGYRFPYIMSGTADAVS